MILADNRERTRFLKFAMVGALGSIVDLGIMNILTRVFHMALVPAGSISFVCAVTNNFIGNRFWTYPDSRSRPIAHQLGMFFLVSTIGITIRIPILKFLEAPFTNLFESMAQISTLVADTLAKNATLIFAIGVVMLWNFFVNRYWTYNDIE